MPYSSCQNPFCLSLTPEARKNLCKISHKYSYPSKQTVTMEIGMNGYLVLLIDGIAITVKQRADGRQIGIECLEKGDLIGVSNLFREEKDYVIFYPKTGIEACRFPTRAFGNLCLEFPELSREIIRNLSQRFAQGVVNLEHITLDNSTERILYLIQKLSYELTALTKHAFSFTHEELALLAGVNRVTASRVIDNLKQSGLIIPLGKGKFRIKEQIFDMDHLPK